MNSLLIRIFIPVLCEGYISGYYIASNKVWSLAKRGCLAYFCLLQEVFFFGEEVA